MPRHRRMPPGEQDAAREAHRALVKLIARDHLAPALIAIARGVDAARSPTTPFDSYYADERKAIAQAFDESFREIWGGPVAGARTARSGASSLRRHGSTGWMIMAARDAPRQGG